MKRKSTAEIASILKYQMIACIEPSRTIRRGFTIGAFVSISMIALTACSSDDDTATDADSAIEMSSEDSSTTDVVELSDVSNGQKDADVTDAYTASDTSDEQDAGCVYEGPPVIDVELLDGCSLCERAHCLSADLVDAEYAEYSDELADCEDGQSKCVPDLYLETGGRFSLETCTSIQDTEGRCMSLCIPLVASLKDYLPTDDCQEDERCTPCFHPVTGDATGACGLSCDPGPTEEAYTFDECCDGISVCVPEDLVPSTDRPNFDEESCSEEGMLCIPKGMAANPTGYIPEGCESWDGSEGRCIPECVPGAASMAAYLTQDRCPDGYICDPCFDPITGDDTGACTIAGDSGPEEDPYTFPDCCDGISACVPIDAIPESDRDLLAQDDCESDETLCVPKALALDPEDYVAESCTIWGGAEGRCLPACLPDIAQQADWLSREDCPEGYLCAPCTDPITEEATSACSIGGDPGPEQDPFTFSECCEGLSLCVPEATVPEADRVQFDSGGCSLEGSLCVPKDIVSDPENYKATKCTSWKGAEGRCLPACLPDVAKSAKRLNRDECDEGFLCVPCTDQITQQPTLACTIGADPGPSDPPVYFDSCCGGISVCVPEEAVPDEDKPNFNGIGCEPKELCVPKDLAADTYVPQHCLSWNKGEARCLPACLPEVGKNAARIEQGSCPDDYLCTPCFDHVSWENTGACSMGGDVGPQQDRSEYVFPECCKGNSVCAHLDAIAIDDRDRFLHENCDEDELCVPKHIGLDPTGYGVDLVHCESWGGGEGRCLSECMKDVALEAATLKHDSDDYDDGCESGFLCVPCFDPVTGDSTGACTEAGDVPTQDPPYQFQKCCMQGETSRGTCVPSALVPDDYLEGLQGDHAPDDVCVVDGQLDEDFLCAPNELASDPDLIQPSNCEIGAGPITVDGLCMADCFSTVDIGLQGNCEDLNDECLPCSEAPCE